MSGRAKARRAAWTRGAAAGLVLLFAVASPSATADEARVVVDAARVEGKIDPRQRYLSKYLVLDWREQLLEKTDGRLQAWRKVWEDVIRRDLREMHEAGMDLLVGSDVAALNIFPGYSIHDEMALFVTELGMTPAEVIERATSRSAKSQ